MALDSQRPKGKTGPKPRGGETSQPVTVRATATEREAWERAAGDLSLSEWARALLNKAAGRVR